MNSATAQQKGDSTVHVTKPVAKQQSLSIKNDVQKYSFSSFPIQTKLTIGSPNDKYEREADIIADRIMRMPMSAASSKPLSYAVPAVQAKCAACDHEEKKIQRKPLMMKSEGETPVATRALGSQLKSTKGSGSPLPSGTNSFMSNAFGVDFSNVRIHTRGSAVQMNQGLNARAFTHGSDIYFNRGEYQPGSVTGKKLLGHELTHVVQQGGENSLNLKNYIQRTCHPESFYISASNYCRDDDFSPFTHPDKTCYRQIPVRSSYFSCPSGEHVCFDSSGHCEDSPDRSSLAEGKESNGSCNWNAFCVAEHTAIDFAPAVADDVAEPFREIGREMMKAFDWRNWLPLAYGY